MAKTSINVRACNIGSAERHNLRSKELDYIRPELTHRNEQWVERSIPEVHQDIAEKYKATTGQGLQKKATPIREGVVVIQEDTTIGQLRELADRLEQRFGVHTFQIYTHKDEGAAVWNGLENEWKPNYFGNKHYWDIDILNKEKFSFYDRYGEFGEIGMSREYVTLKPYSK